MVLVEQIRRSPLSWEIRKDCEFCCLEMELKGYFRNLWEFVSMQFEIHLFPAPIRAKVVLNKSY